MRREKFGSLKKQNNQAAAQPHGETASMKLPGISKTQSKAQAALYSAKNSVFEDN